MNKKFIILLIFLALISLATVSAGENNATVENKTYTHIEKTITAQANESGDSNITFSNGYKGYCVEWREHSAEKGDKFYVKNTSYIINTTGNDVSNYIKVMFLFFPEKVNNDTIDTQHMIWAFTDRNLSQVDPVWYKQIVYIAERCKVPDDGVFRINMTHEFVFSFRTFVSEFEEYQNYFGYKFYIREIKYNSTIQINNLTTNNNITLLPNICFNQTDIQFSEITIKEKEKRTTQSTSTPLIKHICGVNTHWLFGWIIILLITILLFYRKN